MADEPIAPQVAAAVETAVETAEARAAQAEAVTAVVVEAALESAAETARRAQIEEMDARHSERVRELHARCDALTETTTRCETTLAALSEQMTAIQVSLSAAEVSLLSILPTPSPPLPLPRDATAEVDPAETVLPPSQGQATPPAPKRRVHLI